VVGSWWLEGEAAARSPPVVMDRKVGENDTKVPLAEDRYAAGDLGPREGDVAQRGPPGRASSARRRRPRTHPTARTRRRGRHVHR
jgi:hypothetical protein